jgi:hypothetical protein
MAKKRRVSVEARTRKRVLKDVVSMIEEMREDMVGAAEKLSSNHWWTHGLKHFADALKWRIENHCIDKPRRGP